jgi:hypothetical protein
VTDNSFSLANNTLPLSVGAQGNMGANAGGIPVGDGIATTVENTAAALPSSTAIASVSPCRSVIDAGMIVGYSLVRYLSKSTRHDQQHEYRRLVVVEPSHHGQHSDSTISLHQEVRVA